MKEIYKKTEGFNRYSVSNKGNVRNDDTGRILTPLLNIWGYLVVGLYYKSTIGYKKRAIHRLVAKAFIPNKLNKPTVNHNDEVKTNNDVRNLCWMTYKEQNDHGTRNARVSKTLTNGKGSKRVKQLTLEGTLVKIWPSTQEVGRNGFAQSSISACCNGRLKTSRGFKWEFVGTLV